MLTMLRCFAVHLLVMLCGTAGLICAQESAVASKHVDLAAMQFENVQMEKQGVEALFTNLSLSYNIPIGLEIASHDDEFASYALDLKKGTLTDLLTQFAKQHDKYLWEIKDGAVNIFPKRSYREFGLDELLSVQVSKFSVKENSSCWTLVDSLTNTLEVQDALKTYRMTRSGLNFSGGYFPQLGRQFKLDVTDMTLKTILNKVIKESPLAKIWVIKQYSSDRTFVIRLNARNEEFSTSQ